MVEGYQLHEPSAAYSDYFEVKNENIGVDNAYFWDINPEPENTSRIRSAAKDWYSQGYCIEP